MAKTPKAIADMSTLSRVIYDPDTVPPTIPSNVVGTPVSSTRIDLSWVASVDTGGSGMSGYLIYRNAVQVGSTNTTTFSDTGLTSSTAYLYQVAAVDGAGNVSSLSTTISVTTQANVGPPAYAQDQPKAALVGIAGVRTFTDPTQQAFIGRYNWATLGIAGWELWASSGRDADVICKAIKAASTAPGGTLLGPYQNLNAIEEDANDPFPTYTAEIATRNWRLYVSGSSGSLVSPNSGGGATGLVNYTDFVPVNPNLEHPYEFGAAYVYNKFLTKSKSDGRFTGLAAGLASSSFDFVYQDNFLCNPQVNGDWNRDGTTEGQGWPCTATAWLQAGQKRYVDRIRSLAPTKYVVINGGDYGVVTDAGPMAGQADSILAESYMGKFWSWETQRGFVTMLQYYYRVLADAANPELVVFGGSWPDTASDGSALPRLPTANGYPPAYTQEQWARYIAGTAYLGEGMAAVSSVSTGYSSDLSALYWPWFWGGVNGLARSWMGKPVDALRPTTPKLAKGTIGIYGIERTNGIHLVNPRGNGAQVINAADIPGSWQYPAGSPQGTGAFSTYTLAENDSLFLQRVTADGASVSGNVVTLRRAAGGFTTKPTAAPLFYNNFEASSAGALPSTVGLTNSIDATVVNVQADRSFTGTKCMKGVMPANTESFPEVSYLPPANTAEIYVSGMVYWTTSAPASMGQFIFKLTRMGCGQLYHGTPQQYLTTRPNGSGAVTGGDWGYNTGKATTEVAWCSAMYYGSPNTLPGPHSDQWNFMESAHGFSNPSGGSTGYSEMRCNGQNMLPPTTLGGHSLFVNQTSGANMTTGNTNNSGSNAFYSWIIPFFDGLSVPGNTNTSLWVDELYIDNCRNKVVVTDNAVFANSTPGKFLMLVPSSWSDTQIVGTNAALATLFPTGSTANFHIFNNLGVEVVNYSKVMP